VEQQEGVAMELLGATADDTPIGVPIEAAHRLGHRPLAVLLVVRESRLLALQPQIVEAHVAIGGSHNDVVGSLVKEADATNADRLRGVCGRQKAEVGQFSGARIQVVDVHRRTGQTGGNPGETLIGSQTEHIFPLQGHAGFVLRLVLQLEFGGQLLGATGVLVADVFFVLRVGQLLLGGFCNEQGFSKLHLEAQNFVKPWQYLLKSLILVGC